MNTVTVTTGFGVAPQLRVASIAVNGVPQIVVTELVGGVVLSTTLADCVTVEPNVRSFAQAVAQAVEDCL